MGEKIELQQVINLTLAKVSLNPQKMKVRHKYLPVLMKYHIHKQLKKEKVL